MVETLVRGETTKLKWFAVDFWQQYMSAGHEFLI